MSTKTQVEALLSLVNSAARDALAEYEKSGPLPSLDSIDTHPLDSKVESLSLKRSIRLLEGACSQLCASLAPPAHTIVNRAQTYDWACFRVVIEARVADALDGHPNGLHISQLAEIVKIEQGKLARVLRLLATNSCFREVSENVFANNRLSVNLRTSSQVSNFANLLSYECPMAASVLSDTLTDPEIGFSYEPSNAPFMRAVRDQCSHGSYFDWAKLFPERRENFGKSMIAMNHVTASLASLQSFPWQTFSTVCDVGSGIGSFAMPLAKAFPNITVTLQDLPETIGQAKDFWEKDYPEAIQASRVHFVPFDFFEEAPAKGQDIYYVRNIIHNWPDSSALVILRNLRKAMTPNSRLLVHDYVLQHTSPLKGRTENLGFDVAPEPLLPNFGNGNIRMYNQDITMLFMLNAKERTVDEFVKLGTEARLKLEKIWDLAETSMLEFRVAPQDN